MNMPGARTIVKQVDDADDAGFAVRSLLAAVETFDEAERAEIHIRRHPRGGGWHITLYRPPIERTVLDFH